MASQEAEGGGAAHAAAVAVAAMSAQHEEMEDVADEHADESPHSQQHAHHQDDAHHLAFAPHHPSPHAGDLEAQQHAQQESDADSTGGGGGMGLSSPPPTAGVVGLATSGGAAGARQVTMEELNEFMAYDGAVFVCDFPGCGRSVKSRQQLKMHKRHHGYKRARAEESQQPAFIPTPRVFCPVQGCKKHGSRLQAVPLSSMNALVTHWRRTHQEKGSEPYTCSRPKCGKKFFVKKDFQTHEKWCGVSFLCKCGADFESKIGLMGHIKLENSLDHAILNGSWEAMLFAHQQKQQQLLLSQPADEAVSAALVPIPQHPQVQQQLTPAPVHAEGDEAHEEQSHEEQHEPQSHHPQQQSHHPQQQSHHPQQQLQHPQQVQQVQVQPPQHAIAQLQQLLERHKHRQALEASAAQHQQQQQQQHQQLQPAQQPAQQQPPQFTAPALSASPPPQDAAQRNNREEAAAVEGEEAAEGEGGEEAVAEDDSQASAPPPQAQDPPPAREGRATRKRPREGSDS